MTDNESPDDITAVDSNDDNATVDNTDSTVAAFDKSMPHGLANVIAWQSRQRMAYIALFACITVMCAMFFVADPVRVDKLGQIATWFFVSMASIVCAFYGFRTFASIKGLGK